VVGVIVSALVFAWEHAKQLFAKQSTDENGSKIYEVNGAVFFGSVKNFQEIFTPKDDPEDVIIDFANSRVYDHSGLEAIDKLADRYLSAGKTLHIRHLSPECRQLLHKAKDLVEVNVMEDPKYHVADDALES
jgi:SulP family sulfate permease